MGSHSVVRNHPLRHVALSRARPGDALLLVGYDGAGDPVAARTVVVGTRRASSVSVVHEATFKQLGTFALADGALLGRQRLSLEYVGAVTCRLVDPEPVRLDGSGLGDCVESWCGQHESVSD